MDLVIWKLLRCLLNNYQIVTFDILAGEAGFEPTSTVLETAVLPLNYAPIELTSDIIARYFLTLQAFFLLFCINPNHGVRVVLWYVDANNRVD